MKNNWYLIIIVVAIGFFSIRYFTDYREKGLDKVIDYDISHFESLVFYEGVEKHEWKTDKKEHAEAFKEFLSQYRVKRIKDAQWNSDVSKEKGFTATIYSKGEIIIASIYENRLLFVNEGKYDKVINEPIDIDWVENLITGYSY